MSCAQSYMSARSQTRVGVGKPSFLRLTIAGGTTSRSACRIAYLVSEECGGSLRSTGTVAATSNTSRSRNGTRSRRLGVDRRGHVGVAHPLVVTAQQLALLGLGEHPGVSVVALLQRGGTAFQEALALHPLRDDRGDLAQPALHRVGQPVDGSE